MPSKSNLLSSLGIAVLSLPVLLPVIVTLAALVFGDREVLNHLRETVLLQYTTNTLLLMLVVSTVTIVLGVSTAWITSCYRFPGTGWLSIALVLPLATPAYVVGYVYADLLEYSGPVQMWLRQGGFESSLPPIRSLPGAGLVIGFVLYPYVYLLARANFLAQSASLAEAAQSLGADMNRVFLRVAMPLARPAIVGGLALVLMETVADYGVVSHYGVPTFTTGIFRTWFAMGNAEAALQLAGCLFVIAVVLLVFEESARRGQYVNPVSRTRPAIAKQLSGPAGWMMFFICLLPVLIGFFIPVSVLVLHTIESGDGFGASKLAGYAGNTFKVGIVAAVCCVGASLVLAYAARLSSVIFVKIGIRIATLGYALPGMMLAVGVLIPFGLLDRSAARYMLDNHDVNIGLLLTGSLAGLVFVYIARFVTVSFNSISSSLAQISQRYDDAARSLGSGTFTMLRRVHLPILRPAMLTGTVLVFIDVVKELPATLILRPFNFETLATRVYRLASDERLAEASTAALLIVALALLPTLFLVRQSNDMRNGLRTPER